MCTYNGAQKFKKFQEGSGGQLTISVRRKPSLPTRGGGRWTKARSTELSMKRPQTNDKLKIFRGVIHTHVKTNVYKEF